jgi:hypothetical protein
VQPAVQLWEPPDLALIRDGKRLERGMRLQIGVPRRLIPVSLSPMLFSTTRRCAYAPLRAPPFLFVQHTSMSIQDYYDYRGYLASQAMELKACLGDLPGCAPVGYRNLRTNLGTSIELDSKLAPLVREAFARAEAGVAVRKILVGLAPEGLVSRSGKPMGVSALWGVLTNPFYAGKIRYKGELLQGNHKAMIEAELFERVQRRLAQKRRRTDLSGKLVSFAENSLSEAGTIIANSK